MRALFLLMLSCVVKACTVTSQPAQLVEVGKSFQLDQIKPSLASKGIIQFYKIVAADWATERGGLINLDNPKAKAAGLRNEEEAIQIYFYAIDHPQYGRYLIDTGIESTIKDNPEKSPIGGIISRFMNMDKLVIHQTTREWMLKNPEPVKGVFLTHMHLDHIMGMPDLNASIPIFIGPEESTYKLFKNILVRGTTDDFLEGNHTLSELNFPQTADDTPGVIDFFGDQSLFIISVPGHTPGSLAFVVNAQSGPQLILGDTCHTRWGWEQSVPPGKFTVDQEQNQKSLNFLKSLAQSIPEIQVHPGHQSATAAGKLESP